MEMENITSDDVNIATTTMSMITELVFTTVQNNMSTTDGNIDEDPDKENESQSAEVMQLLLIILPSVGGVILFFVFVFCCLRTRKRNLKRRQPSIKIEDFWKTLVRPPSDGSFLPRHSTSSTVNYSLALEHLSVNDNLKDEIKNMLIDKQKLRIGHLIGKGEFGSVHLADLTANGTTLQVAVKSIKEKYKICELEDFLREGAISSSLKHDNILQVIGISIETSSDSEYVNPLVVMPYMKHGDLRTYLFKKRRGREVKNYSISQLIEFTLHIARGMSFLSQKKYIHRDLAARNCMLDGERNNYTVKIADFGLARKIYSSNYQMKKLTKLPFRWLAPEALKYFNFTTKTDVWAFGVTMWEIFSFGQHPYPGVHNCDLLQYLSNGKRLKKPTTNKCPDEMWQLIEDCWRKAPQRRPTFQVLEDRLEEIHKARNCNTYLPVRHSYVAVGLHGSSYA
ncbi:tyrosine-protein kinase receptor TYRO3-like [Anneissia japonica]|uniref:tyrosine-protein kinase receptor TYRO3-like n=1 Tax=Anneissia japonica TaxID=1529436 RepID=UPI0014259CEE|nr:tyrosine-protein kinase receptor TYRO3-like [Anneissia japonica]